jgi:hypothetical protein
VWTESVLCLLSRRRARAPEDKLGEVFTKESLDPLVWTILRIEAIPSPIPEHDPRLFRIALMLLEMALTKLEQQVDSDSFVLEAFSEMKQWCQAQAY